LQDARSASDREVHRDRLIGSKRLDASANIDAIARQIEIRVMPWDAPRRKSGAWLPREPTADSVDGRYRARWFALQPKVGNKLRLGFSKQDEAGVVVHRHGDSHAAAEVALRPKLDKPVDCSLKTHCHCPPPAFVLVWSSQRA
jgi:hypothetical protein